MSPIDELGGVIAPVALFAAGNDAIVPERRTAPLRDAARDLIVDQTIAAGHNDIYSNLEFVRGMERAMKLIGDRSEVRPATQASNASD